LVNRAHGLDVAAQGATPSLQVYPDEGVVAPAMMNNSHQSLDALTAEAMPMVE
jgi:hypothetical protein